ncbi:restriction endonuclease [Cypionkella sinensis]|uniref:Restriction endonuclease n=1 Tax=Cypionkella sinensis TaxID=1756043 RepID=A0ABV7IS61_9RHOB
MGSARRHYKRLGIAGIAVTVGTPTGKGAPMSKMFHKAFVVGWVFIFVFLITAAALSRADVPYALLISAVVGATVCWNMRKDTPQQQNISGPDRAKNDDLTQYPLNGHEFEHWVAAKLKFYGWKAEVTRGSGDQGVDVIAVRLGKQVGIQCKRFSGSVGNGAVQEAIAGKHF